MNLKYIPTVGFTRHDSNLKYIPSYPNTQVGRRGLNYIPTSSSVCDGTFGSTSNTVLEYNLSWWELDKSLFYYPALLVSAFYGMKWNNYREFFNIPKNCIFIGDSGGFQNIQKDTGLKWNEVLEWQEQNCDIIFSLDYPPLLTDSPLIREHKYDKSIKNIELLYKHKNNKIYYSCIHGFNEKELINYYKKIEEFDFDGFSQGQFALRGVKEISKLDRIVLSFMLSENKNIHLLGLGSSTSIAFAHLLSKITKIPFTYDNASYGRGAIGREYNINTYQNIILNQTSNINTISCNCPVCNIATAQEMKTDGSIPGALISLHNLYSDIQKDSWISSLIDSPEDLYKYLRLDTKSMDIKNRFKLLFETQDIEKYIKTYKYELIFESDSSQLKFI